MSSGKWQRNLFMHDRINITTCMDQSTELIRAECMCSEPCMHERRLVLFNPKVQRGLILEEARRPRQRRKNLQCLSVEFVYVEPCMFNKKIVGSVLSCRREPPNHNLTRS
jgi:hypothetical protein